MTIYRNLTGERFVVAGSDDESVILFAASKNKPLELVADERLPVDGGPNDGITVTTKCVTNVMPPEFQPGVINVASRTVVAHMCGTGRPDFAYPDEPVVHEGTVTWYNRLVQLT